jgi:hypothetical protein
MADNITLPSGEVVAADDIAGVKWERLKIGIGPDGSATDWSSTNPAPFIQYIVECSTQVTRPANTTPYTINDALADTTPTAGGFTFSNAGRISGGGGIITDMIVVFDENPATLLQGEVFLFDQAVTAIADNAAFAITDAEARTCLGKVPFVLENIGNNGFFHASNLNIGFVCSGSANLRFLIRVKNAYTPTTNSSIITFVIKVLQVN